MISNLDIAGFRDIDPDMLSKAAQGAFKSNAPEFSVPGAGSGLGFNVPTLQLGIGALGTIGGLYAGLKQLSLAKKAFETQKQFGEINLANQMKSYNTALADRARARAAFEGQTPEQAQAYVDQNKLTR